MDGELRSFLEKFAELERRVRKLAAENRSLKEEVQGLRQQFQDAREEAESLRGSLSQERAGRKAVRDRVDDLIERLEGLGHRRDKARRMAVKEGAGDH